MPAELAAVAVSTAAGVVSSADLGVTLIHEHLLLDASRYFHRPDATNLRKAAIAEAPMSAEYMGVLRHDPFLSKDNLRLEDASVAINELQFFVGAGGKTIVDPTPEGLGRDPVALREIAEEARINVVMGCGYYIEPFHPDDVARMSVDAVADRITADVTDGVGATGIRAGFIGEIGISRDFTSEEEKVLRGAARAQARVHVPLSVHLPGWKRYGLRVLDVVEEEGADPAACILCHMNPSHADEDYQHAIADRGAWLEYDMIGMDWYYADADEQCPCDEELAISIATLARAGYLQRLLLSSDVFLKMMLVRYGGFGYAHVLENFLPRLRRHGLSENDVWQLVTDNPRKVFETAGARGGV